MGYWDLIWVMFVGVLVVDLVGCVVEMFLECEREWDCRFLKEVEEGR